MEKNHLDYGLTALYILIGIFFGGLQSIAQEKKSVWKMIGDIAIAIIVSVLIGRLSEYWGLPVPMNWVVIGLGALLGRNLLDIIKALGLTILKQQIKDKTGVDLEKSEIPKESS